MVSFYEEDDNTVTYMLPEDKMLLGDVPLYLVAYSFYEDRFLTGALYFRGEENYDTMEKICKQRFGEDDVEEGFYEMRWVSQKAFVLLNYDYIEEKGYLILASTPISMEKTKAQEEKEAEKAEGDW